jgi:nucleoside-diphosphate-sugar epimerase
MEVFVTGGGGLLGMHVIQSLLDRGDRARVLALDGEDVSRLDELGVKVYRGDVRDAASLTAPMQDVDAVLHLAGMMGVWRPLADYRAVNVVGTENVCRAALAQGVRRLVHISSWTVYGMHQPLACREDRMLTPFAEPYAVTKAEGDELVRRMIAEEGLPAVIIRPGTFFGAGDHLHFGRIADRLRAKKSIVVGRGNNLLPFVHVSDVAQGVLLGLDHERAVGQVFNITTDSPITQEQLLRRIAREIGADPPRRHVPYRALYAAGYTAEKVWNTARSRHQPPLTRIGVMLFGNSNVHSIDKAQRELGYAPAVPLRDGVMLAASWYRQASVG